MNGEAYLKVLCKREFFPYVQDPVLQDKLAVLTVYMYSQKKRNFSKTTFSYVKPGHVMVIRHVMNECADQVTDMSIEDIDTLVAIVYLSE